MTDRPILFSGPMVRALLEGRKTQTRRLLKMPAWAQERGWPENIMDEMDLTGRLWWFAKDTGCLFLLPIPQVGDRLWVREQFQGAEGYEKRGDPPNKWGNKPIWYSADGNPAYDGDWWFLSKRKRPSIHMPRWASRLTLTVTDVRVQRLQDISAEDCAAEGVIVPDHVLVRDGYMVANRAAFRDLWDSLNAEPKPVKGKGGRVDHYVSYPWEDVHETREHRGRPLLVYGNPWIAAYTFTVEQRNIDR